MNATVIAFLVVDTIDVWPFLFLFCLFLQVQVQRQGRQPIATFKVHESRLEELFTLGLIDSLVVRIVKLAAIHAVLSQGAVGEDVFDKNLERSQAKHGESFLG